MDLTQILAWAVGANTLMTFATTFYSLMSTRATKALKAIEGLETKLNEAAEERQKTNEAIVGRFQLMETRIQQLESDVKHLPDRDHAHKMELAVEKMSGALQSLDARLSGRMDVISEKLEPIAAIGDRWQELILEQAKK